MPSLTPADVRKQIATSQLAPVYMLTGDDEEEKAALIAACEEAIDEGLRAFNVEHFHANDASARPTAVIDAARTLPLMAPRRLIVVHQAERMVAPKRESEQATRELEALEAYVQEPEPHATLILNVGALDRRSRIAKLLLSRAVVVDCGTIEDDRSAARWLRERAQKAGVAIEPAAVAALVERAGADLPRLRADFDRLVLYAGSQKRITAADVREVVGAATSQDAFAAVNAMERGEVGTALRELALLLDAGGIPYMVLGQLRAFVERTVPPQRLPAAVDALMRTDLDLKTSASDARVLLERLVVELCPPERSRARR